MIPAGEFCNFEEDLNSRSAGLGDSAVVGV